MDNPAPWRVLDAPAPGAAPAVSHGASPPGLPGGGPSPTDGLANRTAIVVALIGAVAIAAAAGALAIAGPGAAPDGPAGAAIEAAPDGVSDGSEVVVEVSGAVRSPGVYKLPSTARVADAIEAAGGYGPRVDVERATGALDLAALLVHGGTVNVPSRDDPVAAPGGGGNAGGGGDHLVNLNTASASELEALPGIGPVTAQKILDARAERPFASLDELRERELVGEKTFEKLRDLVTVG